MAQAGTFSLYAGSMNGDSIGEAAACSVGAAAHVMSVELPHSCHAHQQSLIDNLQHLGLIRLHKRRTVLAQVYGVLDQPQLLYLGVFHPQQQVQQCSQSQIGELSMWWAGFAITKRLRVNATFHLQLYRCRHDHNLGSVRCVTT